MAGVARLIDNKSRAKTLSADVFCHRRAKMVFDYVFGMTWWIFPLIIIMFVIIIVMGKIPIAPIIYQNATQEEGATFVLKGMSCAILKFDGNNTLDWQTKQRAGIGGAAPIKITVPAGQHKFTISGVQGASIEMDQILEAGHVYEIKKSNPFSNPTFKDVTAQG
jgi:hypothetical protein